jgi:hypothetical protein
MNTIYITKTAKFSTELSELDFENRDEFGWNDSDDSDFTEIADPKAAYCNEPVKIDTLIKVLEEAKQAGSTHVSIDYHADHIGYVIDGLELKTASQEEIEKYEADRKAAQDKRRQIHDLQAKIARLQNEQ